MSAPDAEALSPMKRAILEIRELKARVAEAERRAREPIAVVGVGLRLPGGANDLESYWNLLWDGVDAIREVPADRWDAEALFDADPDTAGRMNTRWGGFLDDIDRFDAPFFGISPREAESLDPQQRLLLEVTWEALENAGIQPEKLFGSNTGVFLGIANSDHMRMLLADHDQIDTYTTTGNALSVAAGRLSYVLGLQGPAIALDTACSSSLVAVHLAVQSLRNGESDVALAGGVNLILSPELTINFSRARMMAPDGRCKTFDAAADGYVRSEGCAMLALKRLRDAQADGDRVLAVIRGSAVNQDGRSGGITAPNGPSQEQVIAAALADAGVAAHDVSYVEAHGTGTYLGDPIEIGALGAVLCQDRPHELPLLLGSVKTNIGHTEAAAGVAGLIKLVLMLRNHAVPPHLNLRRLNPHIAAGAFPLEVPTMRTPWPSRPGGRIGGVSSFGLSGTNAHIVVGEAPAAAPAGPAEPPTDRAVTPARTTDVLTLSARSRPALVALAERYERHLAGHPEISLADLAFSANTGRGHLTQRLAVVAPDVEAARRQLAAFARHELPPEGAETFVSTPGPHGATARDVVFLFTGHGSHHAGMGRRLHADEPVFRAAIERCDELLRGRLDRRLDEILFGSHDLLDQMQYAQPALFSLQYALTELWASWGVRPSIVAGHSAGEYVAAVVAGVLSLEDGLRLIAARGRLMQTLHDDGDMVALFVDEASVADALVGHEADVGIAAVNGPSTTVISGRREAVRSVIEALGLDDDELRHLDVSVAAHSPLVEPILEAFGREVAAVQLHRPELGLVSSMSGQFADDELTTVDYWTRHLRRPVRFADVFATLHDTGATTFVEIGPHPTLLALGRRNSHDAAITWAPSMRRGADESAQIAVALADVYAAGADVDWAAFADHGGGRPETRRKVDLPNYPWQRESYWSGAARSNVTAPQGVPMWPAMVAAADVQAAQGPLDLDVMSYPRRWATLDRLAVAAIARALRELGLFATAGEAHTLPELFERGSFVAGYEHLAARWLGHLVDDGWLSLDGDRYVSVAPLPDHVAERLAEAKSACTGIEPLLDYIERCIVHLAAVVNGRESALTTLFPDGSYETVDFIYGSWALPRYFNGIVRAAAVAASAARAGRALRVLEIGAGTGGTSAAVLSALPANATTYTFTDVSDFFLARAAERFTAHPFVRYARLDIAEPPEAQGYELGAYDLIIAANVLHATRDLDVTLAHVRALLAPSGVLVAYEGTDHPRWFDITTGLIEGWQLFEDGWRTDVPLIDVGRWTAALSAAGFDGVASFPDARASTATLLSNVLVARAPGDDAVAGRRSSAIDRHGLAAEPLPSPAAALASDLRATLADAMPDERHDILVDAVRRAIAYVLRIADAGQVPRDKPLLDLGFDSLMAVELRNVLTQGLALEQKLPATLVFDHPSVAAIATYLEPLLAERTTSSEGIADDQAVSSDDVATPLVADALADLSEDEVEAMLLKRLTEIEG